MKKSVVYLLFIILGFFFIFNSFLNQYILLKILGIASVMFSIYNLQKGIPHKSINEDVSFVKQDEEEE